MFLCWLSMQVISVTVVHFSIIYCCNMQLYADVLMNCKFQQTR